jgi:ribosomal protein L11 methyltransferase
MMQAMGGLDLKGKKVVDFGTGTGILAILAEKMGASYVLASDCDPGCMENSRENFMLNDCHKIEWALSDVFPVIDKPDTILANINLNVILQNIPAMVASSGPNTEFLFSGVLKTDESQLLKALNESKIASKRIAQMGDWIMIYAYITH